MVKRHRASIGSSLSYIDLRPKVCVNPLHGARIETPSVATALSRWETTADWCRRDSKGLFSRLMRVMVAGMRRTGNSRQCPPPATGHPRRAPESAARWNSINGFPSRSRTTGGWGR